MSSQKPVPLMFGVLASLLLDIGSVLSNFGSDDRVTNLCPCLLESMERFDGYRPSEVRSDMGTRDHTHIRSGDGESGGVNHPPLSSNVGIESKLSGDSTRAQLPAKSVPGHAEQFGSL